MKARRGTAFSARDPAGVGAGGPCHAFGPEALASNLNRIESMDAQKDAHISALVSMIPYRLALAGGWIDQPFISKLNPAPPGSMVVVGVEPTFRFMDRCGIATSSREVARKLWNDRLPDRDPAELVRELYAAENRDRPDPSGSQDMIGLIYPGINRLDYEFRYEGGLFPAHIESNNDPAVAHWLEGVIHILPVAQRPAGYSPLGEKQLDPEWVERLGRSGRECFDAILGKNVKALGASLNECMQCWEALLPHTVRHPALSVDLVRVLSHYQARYAGAMYSGCGGGYLYVAAEEEVPGSFQVEVRLEKRTRQA